MGTLRMQCKNVNAKNMSFILFLFENDLISLNEEQSLKPAVP